MPHAEISDRPRSVLRDTVAGKISRREGILRVRVPLFRGEREQADAFVHAPCCAFTIEVAARQAELRGDTPGRG